LLCRIFPHPLSIIWFNLLPPFSFSILSLRLPFIILFSFLKGLRSSLHS
jgi:ABC-type nitrate/sulfonate/bicarbonate transport system permease component